MGYNYKNKTYLAPFNYLISHYIYEYDISKANINVLFFKGIIDKNTYEYLKSLPRGRRQIIVGNMQKDNNIATALSEGLAEFRYRFITANNIKDYQILSVKNDAIFLIDTIPQFTKFDNIEFVQKNIYTSFYYLNKLEVYYYLDIINDREIIDIKGINDESLKLHQDYIILFLCTIFDSIQSSTLEEALNILLEFEKKYTNRELEIGYYREFNSDSKFRITFPNGQQYLLSTINENDKMYLNINTNLCIIREIYSIISSMYFSKRR